ncbi:MUC5A protein, partial [Trogon melanurus]|nr:MUC5A protein [Trogon melanurus]
TSTTKTTTPVTTSPSTTPLCIKEECHWSMWYDASYPESGYNDGDFDTVENIRKKGFKVCDNRKAIECRAVRFPNTPYQLLEQHITCTAQEGLICYNKDQLPPICYNYEVRFKCCANVTTPCETPTVPHTTTKTIETQTTTSQTPPIITKHVTTATSKPPSTEHIHSKTTTQTTTHTSITATSSETTSQTYTTSVPTPTPT